MADVRITVVRKLDHKEVFGDNPPLGIQKAAKRGLLS